MSTNEILAPGLYDADNNLVVSWEALTTTYGMNIQRDHDSDNVMTEISCPYYILNNYSELSVGTKLVIDDSVTRIGEDTFWACRRLTNIHIPESVTSIGREAFGHCSSLKSITIPDSVTSFGAVTFWYCENLENVVLGNNVTTIDRSMFTCCTSLKSLTLGNNISSIEAKAFKDCTQLSDVYITNPSNWCKMNFVDQSNPNCYGAALHFIDSKKNEITSISLDSTVTSIPDYRFQNASNLINIYIPDGVTKIGESAFSGCSNLKNIYIPDSVKSIGWRAFMGCSSLTAIYIPDGVTGVMHYTFTGCTSLVSVYIPASLTPIIGDIFTECPNFQHVYYGGTEEQWYNAYSYSSGSNLEAATKHFNHNQNGGGLARIFTGSVISSAPTGKRVTLSYAGKKAKDDAIISFRSAGSITYNGKEKAIDANKIVTLSCAGKKMLTDVVIGEYTYGLYDSEDNLVASWYTLVNDYGMDVKTSRGLGNYASDKTTPYYILNNNEELFSGTKMVIPENADITAIGSYSFYNCDRLTKIVIPNSVTNIGTQAFGSCDSLGEIVIVSSNENYYIDEQGVLYTKDRTTLIQAPCNLFGEYVIPDGVTTVKYGAFENCTSLTAITIPNSALDIGMETFSGCSSLVSANIPEGIIEIPSGMFRGCTSLAYIDIPSSVTTIGSGAFYDCSSLASIDIHNNITTIGSSAFSYCTSLPTVSISANVTSIGDCPFRSCSNLDGIWVSSSNTKYCSDDKGILYNKDKTRLLQAPASLSGSYTIPDSVTSVSTYSFENCSGISDVIFGSGVKFINEYAFKGCTGLTDVVLSNSVAYLINGCFLECSNLYSIVLPVSLSSIGNSVFYKCNKFRYIYYRGTEEQWSKIFNNSEVYGAKIIYNYV